MKAGYFTSSEINNSLSKKDCIKTNVNAICSYCLNCKSNRQVEDITKNQLEVLLKQYEMSRLELKYLDEMYSKTVLLYLALMGAYIGNIQQIVGENQIVFIVVFIAITLFVIGSCVLGIIRRTRNLYDKEIETINEIITKTDMVSLDVKPIFLQKMRTSTYFSIIVVIITLLAIILTTTI